MSWLPFLAVPAGVLISLPLTFLFIELLAGMQGVSGGMRVSVEGAGGKEESPSRG